jgi:hypothetical protein
MPTKRTVKTRKRAGGAAEIAEAAAFYRFFHLCPGASTWAEGKSKTELSDFWRCNKKAIMAEDSRQRQEANKPFQRPMRFWDELERTHPRLQVGVVEWWPPWTAAGPPTKPESEAEFENDQEFLTRLGLLAPWEVELLKKRTENGNLQEKENANIDKTATA